MAVNEDDEVGREDIIELDDMTEIESWVVVRQIGRGAYGQVFHVINKDDDREGAMKIESLEAEEHILRIELDVLKAFKNTSDTYMQLHAYGATDNFSFVVMSLGGPDLTRLEETAGPFKDSTLVRIALRTLMSLKSLHEIGYIHRDLKPCNYASSLDGTKVIHVIDFGMTRKFANQGKNSQWILRKKRNHVAFRGTVRYCSLNVHRSKEQGRVDDLWSWLFMCLEFRVPLPWRKLSHRDRVMYSKEKATDKQLCGEDPITTQYVPIAEHLRTLEVYDRPNYQMIASIFEKIMKERDIKLLDEYDWEGKQDEGNETAQKINAIYEKFNIDRPKRKGGLKKSSPAEEDAEWKQLQKAAATTDIPGGEQYVDQKGRSKHPSNIPPTKSELGDAKSISSANSGGGGSQEATSAHKPSSPPNSMKPVQQSPSQIAKPKATKKK